MSNVKIQISNEGQNPKAKYVNPVIPAKAGIQGWLGVAFDIKAFDIHLAFELWNLKFYANLPLMKELYYINVKCQNPNIK